MALKNGKVNHLNALGLRVTSFPAHHFHYTVIEKYNSKFEQELNRWIYQHLNGRYFVGQGLCLINNTFSYVTKVGFEQEKELSFFRISCPLLS
jgi:hypothetical protein